MKEADFSKLDFDAMSVIARDDPVEFERLRQAAIDKFIESAPQQRRKRLRGLQWRIDLERRGRSPLSACLRISRMMWDHLLETNGLLGLQSRFLCSDSPRQVSSASAKIIPFPDGNLPRH